jgi:cobalt-zinc-cadmium efflux system outer membrane protein
MSRPLLTPSITGTALLLTVVGSMFAVGCVSQVRATPVPLAPVYAPAELVDPYVPLADAIDPQVVTRVGLSDLLVYADAHAPVIQTARARVGLVSAGRIDADIALPANPELGFGIGGRTVGGTTGFEFEVSIEQQFELAGQRELRTAAVSARETTAEAVVNEVRWAVHVETHRLFVDLLLVEERRQQAERFMVFARSMRDIAARQVDAGDESPLILLVAEADLAHTQEAVIEATHQYGALQTRLAALIGWPRSELPALDGALPPLRRAPSTEQLLRLMAESHPALRTRELAVAALHRELELADREARPGVTLGLSYGREAAPGPAPEANVWMMNVRVPIPAWRTNEGASATAEAELSVADAERNERANELRSEMLQAAIALNAAAERVEMYQAGIVPQFEENLALLQRAYELGEVDVHQVSQTRERLLNATARSISARIAYYETAAALEGLVGTEFWEDEEHTH